MYKSRETSQFDPLVPVRFTINLEVLELDSCQPRDSHLLVASSSATAKRDPPCAHEPRFADPLRACRCDGCPQLPAVFGVTDLTRSGNARSSLHVLRRSFETSGSTHRITSAVHSETHGESWGRWPVTAIFAGDLQEASDAATCWSGSVLCGVEALQATAESHGCFNCWRL